MTLKLTLTGPIPSKKNSRSNIRLKSGRIISIPCESYTKWHKENYLIAKSKSRGFELNGETPFSISVNVYFKDKRRRDLDNIMSSILDLLVDAKVIPDDCWTKANELYIKGNICKNDFAIVEINQKTTT